MSPEHKKTILLSVGDGPESIELYTDDDRGVRDFSRTFPAVYLAATIDGARVELGPFQMPAIYRELTEATILPLPDVDVVAAKVHDSWMQERRSQGIFSWQPNGEELMVPYEQLSEQGKNLDRATVRAVYQAIDAKENL